LWATFAATSLSGNVCKAQTEATPEDVYARSFAAAPPELLDRLHELDALPQQDAKSDCVEAYVLSALRRLEPQQWRACLGVAPTIASAPDYLKQVCASEAAAETCRSALEPEGYHTTELILTSEVNTIALQEASEGSTELVRIFDRKLENAERIVVNAPSTECELAVYTSRSSITVNRCAGSYLTHEKDGDVLQLALVLPPEPTPAPPIPAPPTPTPPTPAPPTPAPHGAPAQTQRIAGVAVAGAGVVAMGIGVGLGFAAKSSYDGAACEGSVCENEAAKQERDSARQQGNVATGIFVAGAALAVGGGVLWLLAPSSSKTAATHGLRVGVGPERLLVRGNF
jgi:hypothetical protein